MMRRPLGSQNGWPGARLVEEEQLELAAKLAMVAFAGFLDLPQVVVELVLGLPGRAVDALQHRPLLVTPRQYAPETLSSLKAPIWVRVRHVRATTQVEPVRAGPVEADRLVVAQGFDDLALVGIFVVRGRVVLERLVPGPLLAHERFIGGDDLAHRVLDARQVVFAQLGRDVDVVVEAVFDDRPDAQPAARIQLLDGLGQHVGRRMAHHVQFGVRGAAPVVGLRGTPCE